MHWATKNTAIAVLFFVAFFASCQKDQVFIKPPNALLATPAGFPSVPWPAENTFTQARWNLGKKLFFDPVLSKNNALSCGSCHTPHLAFSDSLATTAGVFGRPGTRNAPTLTNMAYLPYYLKEGSVPTLEMQILVPIQEHNEFGHNIVDIAALLQNLPEYVKMSQEAYARMPDPYVITRAIATFERTLISGNSLYDQYRSGKKSALNESQKRGMDLFFSEKTNCSACHGGFNFTNNAFENNGLYEIYADEGRARFTHLPQDVARFKVPTLRNTSLTAPYMHDGSVATLAEVVAHYNSGGANHPNKSALLKPLNLSAQEQQDLAAFLQSLQDDAFANNALFRP